MVTDRTNRSVALLDDSRVIIVSVRVREGLEVGRALKIIQLIVAVHGTVERLYLKHREICIKRDRHIGSGQTNVCKERAKPTIRLDNAFEEVVAPSTGEVYWAADKQAPSWPRPSQKP